MSALVRYEAARTALAEAHRIDEVKDIRDKAEAMAAYARQAKDNELVQYATEIKVRAERRCGELLRDAALSGERAGRGKPVETSHASTLTSLGLTRDESSRYQQLAAMPEDHFETVIAIARATASSVTTAHMLREAKRGANPKQESPEDRHRLVELSAAHSVGASPLAGYLRLTLHALRQHTVFTEQERGLMGELLGALHALTPG